MRFLMASVTAAAILALGAGCGNSDTQAGGAAATSAPAASPSAPANDPACTDIKTIHIENLDKVMAALVKADKARTDGDQAGSRAGFDEARTLTGAWAGKLEPIVAKVTNVELKTALTEFAATLKRYGTGAAEITEIQTTGRAMTSTLLKYCG